MFNRKNANANVAAQNAQAAASPAPIKATLTSIGATHQNTDNTANPTTSGQQSVQAGQSSKDLPTAQDTGWEHELIGVLSAWVESAKVRFKTDLTGMENSTAAAVKSAEATVTHLVDHVKKMEAK